MDLHSCHTSRKNNRFNRYFRVEENWNVKENKIANRKSGINPNRYGCRFYRSSKNDRNFKDEDVPVIFSLLIFV